MSPPLPSLRPRWLPLPGWSVAALLLAAHFFSPATGVLDASLDASNYASYAAFTAQGRPYGTEVVPLAGPYGFVMYGWIYGGDLYGVRFALEFLTKLVFAAAATRPEFYLLKLQTIDGRFVTQDDGTTLDAILHDCRPVLAERGMLLLRTDRAAPPARARRSLGRHPFRLGEEIPVPAVAADRGTQTFDVPLPSLPSGSRLVVRTDPGPHGDAGWDWTYLAHLRFE